MVDVMGEIEEFRTPRIDDPRRRVYEAGLDSNQSGGSGSGPKGAVFRDLPSTKKVSMSKRRLKMGRRKISKFLLVIPAVLVIAGAVLLTLYLTRPRNPISLETLKDFTVQSYYPTYLPPGFTLHPENATVTGGALTFTAVNTKTGQSLFFSEQAKQPDFDLATFYSQELPDGTTFITPYGNGIVGHFLNVSLLEKQHLGATPTAPSSTVGSLNATKTWVLVSAPTDFNTSELHKVIMGLRQ